MHGIGGLLKHAPAVLAFAAPTTNSYRRLVPGFEAPINLVMSARNRSAAVRIPMYSDNPKAKRLEFRCPDSTANGYLMFSAMMMAVLDGIENKIDPGTPLDRDIYEMTPDELSELPAGHVAVNVLVVERCDPGIHEMLPGFERLAELSRVEQL